MVTVLGMEIDLFSFIPAVCGVLLSIYNWMKARQGANIYPSEIINYGIIRVDQTKKVFFCIPIILDNKGTNMGLVKDIKIGFKDGDIVKNLIIMKRIELRDLDLAKANNISYTEFVKDLYNVKQRIYPITVNGKTSTEVILLCYTYQDDMVLPIGKEIECEIAIQYGKKNTKKTEFPFILSQEDYDNTKSLRWLKPDSKTNMREQFPESYERKN